MPPSLVSLALLVFLALPTHNPAETAPLPHMPPLPPDTSVPASDVAADTAPMVAARSQEPASPARITVPSLGIDSPVIPVGVNAKGEMAVPDGSTNSVGWYEYGTLPGAVGSAVMDAHVFAAFKRLKSARVGESIFVLDTAGTTHEFKITASAVYPTSEVPMQAIFTKEDGAYLNLITCEGRYSAVRGTYDHRRVIYAERVR